ncbi:MAG: NAD+ synthase [Balneolaceae bacterium]
MKIRVEQLNPVIGGIDGNAELILEARARAEEAQIDLLILPEMILTGYPALDLLESGAFCEYCYKTNRRIIGTAGKTALLFGTLTRNPSRTGRKIFNSAVLCHEGEKLAEVHKTLLPTYDVFDDLRYFEPGKTFECMEFKGLKLGVTICEDIWYNENEVQYHTYEINPAAELKALGAQLIVNISASPYTKNKHPNRLRILGDHVENLDLPVIYCNQVGAHTDVLFDGDSLVINPESGIIAIADPFEPGFVDVEWHRGRRRIEPVKDTPVNITAGRTERLMLAVQMGIRDYFEKTSVSGKAVLGLSGGIDSALVAVLASEALGPENVTGLLMPGEFSSSGSIEDSKQLAGNLGMEIRQISISGLYDAYQDALSPLFRGTSFGVAEENLQSRIRGSLLMAYSNKFGHILLTTGNKSELSVGYATLYGDMNGGLNPIGDLYKTEVFDLCRWLNETYFGEEMIPREILDKPPSAELRPGQKDTDSLPEYPVLDDILWRYIELQQEAAKIAEEGNHPCEVVKNILSMVDRNEFKRFQAPPILKLSSKSFGSGRRWPVVQRWTVNR